MGRQVPTIADADPPAQDSTSIRSAGSRARGLRAGKSAAQPIGGQPDAETVDNRPAPTGDPLFNVVRYLAALSGKSVSRDAIVAGLPLVRGRLTERLLPEALARVGLTVTSVRKAFSQLDDFEMPTIFVSLKGKVQVCLGRDPSGLYRCFDGESEQILLLDRASLNLRLKRNF